MAVVLGVALAVALCLIAYLLIRGRGVRLDPLASDQLLARLQAEVVKAQAELQQQAVGRLREEAKALVVDHEAATEQRLKSRNEQIEAVLGVVRQELERLRGAVAEADRRQEGAYQQLRAVAAQGAQQTELLRQETARLKEMLGGNQSRGSWAERMADDVVRQLGMVEGVQYARQLRTASGSRPDFTFFLEGKKLHMDVKASFANYRRYLEAEDDRAREEAAKAFLRDLKARIDEVAGRGYIDPEDDTVEFVLLFIPYDQIFSFIHERDQALVDYALSRKVVICSPLTLFAVLAVIQQAARTAQLSRQAGEVLNLLNQVQKEWTKVREKIETLGNRLEQTTKVYDELATTRVRQLQRALDKVERL